MTDYSRWDTRYETGDLPWDTGRPEPLLVELADNDALPTGRALVVGAGTGTNALWLAEQGLDVLAVDVSAKAVEMARARVGDRCRVEVADFLAGPIGAEPFDFVFDRGCFHSFQGPQDQARFAEVVAESLATGGLWLSLIGSTEGPARDHGPPRRNLREVVSAVEPHLEIVSISDTRFRSDQDSAGARAWRLLACKREVEAQPSSRR